MSFTASVSLSGLRDRFASIQSATAGELSDAINDAAQSLIDNALTEIGQQTDLVSTAIVSEQITLDRARPQRPIATIHAAERHLPMSFFRPIPIRSGVAANMRINRGVQFIPGAFISARFGSRQVFIAVGPRLQVVFGPSTANLFEDAAELHLDATKDQIVQKLR